MIGGYGCFNSDRCPVCQASKTWLFWLRASAPQPASTFPVTVQAPRLTSSGATPLVFEHFPAPQAFSLFSCFTADFAEKTVFFSLRRAGRPWWQHWPVHGYRTAELSSCSRELRQGTQPAKIMSPSLALLSLSFWMAVVILNKNVSCFGRPVKA